MGNSGRFRSTARFYARFRPRYPQALIERVALHCRLDGSGRMMDLGCGPGFLAIAFAPYFATVVGVDPEPEMLEVAAEEAKAAGVALTLVAGQSRDLGPHWGRFRMVAMGRSFHWMDRDATLLALDALIDPGGFIVLVDAAIGGRAWRDVWPAVLERWSTPELRAAADLRATARWEGHESVLARSPFRHVDRVSARYDATVPVEALIGRAYSMSQTTPAVIGSRGPAFEAALRAAFLAIEPSGVFHETFEVDALIARRP